MLFDPLRGGNGADHDLVDHAVPLRQRRRDRARILHRDGRLHRPNAHAGKVGRVRRISRIPAGLGQQSLAGRGAQRDAHIGHQRRGFATRRGRAGTHRFGRLPGVRGRHPIEEHPVGQLPGQATHLGTEGRRDDAHLETGPERADSLAHARERPRVCAADTQEETVERQRVGADALVDAVGAARMQRNHPNPQVDAPGHLRRRRERREPIGLTWMVDPKGTVPPPFGLSR